LIFEQLTLPELPGKLRARGCIEGEQTADILVKFEKEYINELSRELENRELAEF